MIFSESDFLVQGCAANWHRRVYMCSVCNYHSAMDIGGGGYPPAPFTDRPNLFESVVSIRKILGNFAHYITSSRAEGNLETHFKLFLNERMQGCYRCSSYRRPGVQARLQQGNHGPRDILNMHVKWEVRGRPHHVS